MTSPTQLLCEDVVGDSTLWIIVIDVFSTVCCRFRSRAVISNFTANDFRAYSTDGFLDVLLSNTGPNRGDFTVDITCSEGLLLVFSKQITILASPAKAGLQFPLYSDSNIPREASCVGAVDCNFPASVVKTRSNFRLFVATVRDGLSRVTDMATVAFNISAFVVDKGSQEGSLSDGAPTTSTNSSSSGGSCAERCTNKSALSSPVFCTSSLDHCLGPLLYRWNVLCTMSHPFSCIGRLTTFLSIIAPLLAYAALAAKFPSVCVPSPCVSARIHRGFVCLFVWCAGFLGAVQALGGLAVCRESNNSGVVFGRPTTVKQTESTRATYHRRSIPPPRRVQR
jgi:hypothetical protein